MSAAGLGAQNLRTELDASRVALALADKELQDAQAARRELGVTISHAEVDGLEDNIGELTQSLSAKQQQLADKRASVRILCSNDPQGQVELLNEEIPVLEAELATEERKLGGLVLLELLLNAERLRLSRLLVEPLNQQVAPWLEEIRGRPTRLVVDENGGKIAGIVTRHGEREQDIPFSELSGGLKGQIALLVRLTLARTIAQQRRARGFVILDDPLTETSPQRRPEMLRVLSQAAQDLQILLITCHGDAFACVPGLAHRIQF
jgi:uncharacterized protein YhaN